MSNGRDIPGEGSGRNLSGEDKSKNVGPTYDKGSGSFGDKGGKKFVEKIVGPGKGKYGHNIKPNGGNGGGKGGGDDADVAKKLARIAAIKKAALNNKKSNVGTSTAADAEASPALSSLLTGGGGYGSGYLADSGGNGGFSFSDIPSIVWIVLAVGAGYWLMKSGGKGKLF